MSNSNLQNNTSELNELLALAISLPEQVTDAVKYTEQSLTEEQKAQARTNIGAVSSSELSDASTTSKGIVQLTDSVSSTSTTTAATPNSVKSAYDLANAALPKSGGTMTGALEAASLPIATKTVRNVIASTADLVDGSSTLETGMIYLVYEE